MPRLPKALEDTFLEEKEEQFNPNSPTFSPTSPGYTPGSPVYSPNSPVHGSTESVHESVHIYESHRDDGKIEPINSGEDGSSDFEDRPPPSLKRPENITISEDRSAGSNLEARNLAALKNRNQTLPKKKAEKRTGPYHPIAGRISTERFANPPSTQHVKVQKRFGQLRLGKETLIGTGISSEFHGTRLDGTRSGWASKKASKDQHESNKDGLETDPSDRLRTDIEKLQRKVAHMQQALRETEMQQQQRSEKRYQVLYRLDSRCYLDHPEWTQGRTSIVSHRPLQIGRAHV